MRKKWLFLYLALFLIFLSLFLVLFFSRGKNETKLVALTFDDGPSAKYTPKILEILEKYNAPATFFVVGDRVQAYPNVVRLAYEKGFAVANHSFDHETMFGKADIEIIQEIQKTDTEIRLAVCGNNVLCNYKPAKFFRPPYGETNIQIKKVVAGLGYTEVLWNIYSYDNDAIDKNQSYKEIVWTIFSHQRYSKEIVLMHDAGRDHTKDIEALPEIIERYRELGYKLVTVADIVK